jgi:prolyl 4-hydroxylase
VTGQETAGGAVKAAFGVVPAPPVQQGLVGDEPVVVDASQDEESSSSSSSSGAGAARGSRGEGYDPRKVEVLSLDRPRAFLYHGFLTHEECDHLVAISRGGLHKSGVVDAETGGSTLSDIRTSSGSFIGRGFDDITRSVERRIAAWSQIPEGHGEAIQVLRYERGQEYRAHFDYFFHKQGMANNRIATVLLYLSDVEEGGETVFPNAPAPPGQAAAGNWSACAAQGLAVKAVKGNALLFWSMKVGGELDGGSSHAGCPVIQGEKWTATKWMHVAPADVFDAQHQVYKEPRPVAKPGCEDADERCFSWAEQGECKRNPGFMLGSCKASCEACDQK